MFCWMKWGFVDVIGISNTRLHGHTVTDTMPWLATKASAIHLLFTDSFLLFDFFKTHVGCLRDRVLGLLVLHLHLDNLSDEVLCLHQLRPNSRQ